MERARQRKRDADPAYRLKKKTLYSSTYKRKAKQLRDQGGICYLCGQVVPPGTGEADHIIPSNPESPLAITHRKCNINKSNKPLDNTGN